MNMNDFIRQQSGRGQPPQPVGLSDQQETRMLFYIERGASYADALAVVRGTNQALPRRLDMNQMIRKAAGR